MRRTLVAILIAGLLAGGLGLPPSGAGPAAGGGITLYTSESEDDVNLLVGEFTRHTPGVAVRIFRAGTGPVEAKVEAELTAGRIQADVLWFADLGFLQVLARKGLLLPFAPPAARGVAREFHYEGNQMHEVRLIFNIIGINTRQVRFRPASWWDLTRPRYKGRVGLPNPFVSGAAFAHVGTFAGMRMFGWDFYRALRENNVVILRSNGDVLQKLASGEIAVAQIVDFFVRHARDEGSPVDSVWPAEGAVLVPTPVAIVRGTGAADAARAFVNFLYTAEAQRLFVQRAYVPVMPGVALPAGAPALAGIKVIPPDVAYIDRHREEIKRNFTALFGVQ